MANKVKFGLKNCHYSPITISDDGEMTFGTPVRLPGAVNLALDAQGETEEFYADDIAYFVTTGNTGYSGTLEIADIPDHFRRNILHESEDNVSHVLIENAFAEPSPFALLYEVSGDEKATRRVLYYCTVSRPGENAQTTQATKTPQTDTMNMTATAMPDGTVRARTTSNTPDGVFNGWFNQVWRPAAAA